MAHAVQSIYPEAKFGVGPAIDTGFYYDIDIEHKAHGRGFAKN
jgi:threonyl-tRNA synthetase